MFTFSLKTTRLIISQILSSVELKISLPTSKKDCLDCKQVAFNQK